MTTSAKDVCNLTFKRDDGVLTIVADGQISSANAAEVEAKIKEELHDVKSVLIDCSTLSYISSAGLRILLRIKKIVDNVKAVNVSNEVYDIFDVTGFTEMIDVRKAYRKLSVAGCTVIGEGANGIVYRYADDTIVKVYKDPDALDDIERERELARTAFVLGVPTAISYDIVQVEGGLYGSVFELLKADSYHHLLKEGKKTVDEIAKMSADLLKIVHSTEPKPGILPQRKRVTESRLKSIKEANILPEEEYNLIVEKTKTIPEDGHMLHGDFHVKNVMIQDGESLLIDMDTLCVGNPVYELAGMYLPYVGFGLVDPQDPMRFFGLSTEVTTELYEKIMAYYFEDRPEELETAKKKAIFLSMIRLLYYCAVNKHITPENKDAVIALSRKTLNELLPQLDTLVI